MERSDEALRTIITNSPLPSRSLPAAGLLQLFHERLLQKVLVRDKRLAVKRYDAMISLAIKEAEAGNEPNGLEPEVKRGLKKFRREHEISKIEHKEVSNCSERSDELGMHCFCELL